MTEERVLLPHLHLHQRKQVRIVHLPPCVHLALGPRDERYTPIDYPFGAQRHPTSSPYIRARPPYHCEDHRGEPIFWWAWKFLVRDAEAEQLPDSSSWREKPRQSDELVLLHHSRHLFFDVNDGDDAFVFVESFLPQRWKLVRRRYLRPRNQSDRRHSSHRPPDRIHIFQCLCAALETPAWKFVTWRDVHEK